MDDKSIAETVVFRGDQVRMAALGRLASGMAHDMNNLLGAIEGYAVLAAGALPADSQARKDMESIREAVRSGADLNTRLLLFGRRRAMQKVPCRADELLNAAAPAARAAAGVRVVTEIAPALPEFQADPDRLGGALAAMVRNALEAMPEGGSLTIGAEKVRARGGSGTEEDLIRLFVRDAGPGMSPEVLEHAFEPYYTTKPAAKGLGLALAYGIAAMHCGWAELSSKPGKGCEASLYIPISPPRT